MRRLIAGIGVIVMVVGACGTTESPNPSPSPTASSAAASASTGAPAPAVHVDENAYLSGVINVVPVFGGEKPTVLLQRGYAVCDEIKRGWAWEFIKRELSDDSSSLDYTGAVAVSAAAHLCGMSQQQVDEYTKTHVPLPHAPFFPPGQ